MRSKHLIYLSLLAISSLTLPTTVAAQIWSCTDQESGTTSYTYDPAESETIKCKPFIRTQGEYSKPTKNSKATNKRARKSSRRKSHMARSSAGHSKKRKTTMRPSSKSWGR